MIIEELSYTNYKGLQNSSIRFDPHLTVLIGKNGSGKSSVLQAVEIAISWIIARIRSEKGNGLYIEEQAIANGQLHAQIKARFDEFGEITIPNRTKSGLSKKYSIDLNGLKEYAARVHEDLETSHFKSSVPVFAFYGVERAVIDIPLRIRNTEEHILETYNDCLKGAANFRDFFMWFRNQEDLENENRLDAHNGTHYTSRELDAFRRALRAFIPEYSAIRVRRRPLRMTLRKGQVELNVAQLSDGEKIYLALIGDLCRRLVLANPELNDPLQGRGIVLIDEVDLHLHPAWQSEIAERLCRVFPNLQFIVTTHSPQVINRVPTDCLRIMNEGAANYATYGYGMPTPIVLKDIMGVGNEQPKEIEDTINGFYEALADSNLNGARRYLATLENGVPEHPELPRMRKILERHGRRR